MIHAGLELAFWISTLLLGYIYLGYPAVIAALGRYRSRKRPPAAARPTVTLLVVAYNEAGRIARKLENCLALEYPRQRFEIVVASDGSTDETVEIAEKYSNLGITVLAYPSRRGKPAVLNDAIAAARGDIVVLADARQLYAPDAIAALVDRFGDPAVGAVSGELVLIEDGASTVGRGVGFYWRYEKFIRYHESHLDSAVGTTGAIYAIRRRLFEPIPPDTVLDDVLIPLRIVRKGYRVVFEPRARAYDSVAESSAQEFVRKVRTIAGNLQLFVRERWLWNPIANRLWFQVVSHKLLRIFGPLLLGTVFVTSAMLAAVPDATRAQMFRVSTIAQLLFYAAAVAGATVKCRGPFGRLLGISYAFCLLNATAAVGIVRFALRKQTVTWERASFPIPANPVAAPGPDAADSERCMTAATRRSGAHR